MTTIKDFENLDPTQLRQLELSFDCETAYKISELWLDGVTGHKYKLTDEILSAVGIVMTLPTSVRNAVKVVHIFDSPFTAKQLHVLFARYGVVGTCVQREACIFFLPHNHDDDVDDNHIDLDRILHISHASSVDLA